MPSAIEAKKAKGKKTNKTIQPVRLYAKGILMGYKRNKNHCRRRCHVALARQQLLALVLRRQHLALVLRRQHLALVLRRQQLALGRQYRRRSTRRGRGGAARALGKAASSSRWRAGVPTCGTSRCSLRLQERHKRDCVLGLSFSGVQWGLRI